MLYQRLQFKLYMGHGFKTLRHHVVSVQYLHLNAIVQAYTENSGLQISILDVNPYMTNGLHLGESNFIFMGIRSNFKFLFSFSMNFL